jgi:hypothetical protein
MNKSRELLEIDEMCGAGTGAVWYQGESNQGDHITEKDPAGIPMMSYGIIVVIVVIVVVVIVGIIVIIIVVILVTKRLLFRSKNCGNERMHCPWFEHVQSNIDGWFDFIKISSSIPMHF